jgi:hypothetical protein
VVRKARVDTMLLQTYFTAKGLIDYFIIDNPLLSLRIITPTLGRLLLVSPSSQQEGELFKDLKADSI